ncbi:FprA family A-type flavoprotein [Eubacterium sp. am_0171]|uniref:Anaerobic nitric oxide reductase flavorubredoxin n=1 Tax=Faecalicatena contorta TaxID=39482 RepID=A0A174M7W4_9FIRM|nr:MULTISPECIES: FprA family A-type flavoprotein [Clostridia]MSC84093.1 MBL fold metallo-hydrolase [Eubacterium sp. BIOML-A1]MSD06520.1 MBL fold metallo-hydrolase [Eubacterium sp. BIOML-A2]RYT19603.1 FprA family A-type flavoprotein [Eubacterium sp. am_0171]CUP30957.1 Anaerobic nitric oxide reductase flavorubredoxin [[Eubacterium] contortum] [Faecalicatena contorta]
MYCFRKVTDDLYWVGGSDRRLELFENIFPIPNGVSYNSYLLMDEKTVLFDTVDASIGRQFLENVEAVLGGRTLDYLVVNHMEPDHCSLIAELALRYPKMQIIGNAKTFPMIGQFYDMDLEDRKIIIKEGDTFSSGTHTLHFVMAPMVHWPEAMMTYDEADKVLFSADAFGTFGALGGTIFNDEINFDRDWLDDARRYYTNIVGKYGVQVQNVLKKAAALDIRYICSLHGPVWRSNLDYIIGKYNIWSTYEPEVRGVMIAYASMYGNTENAANVLAVKLADAGVKNMVVHDISRTHVSQLISDSFKYSHLVLASPTYNGGVYPVMANYLDDMKALNVQNRTVAVLGNGTWAPMSAKLMEAKIGEMKNMTILTENFAMKSSLKDSQMEEMDVLAARLAKEILGNE